MRVYRYSWKSENAKCVEVCIDKDVLMHLIETFKQSIKDAVEKNDFKSAREHLTDLDVLEAKLEDLLELEKEDADSESEQ